jgi:hypothetical protein
VIARRLVRRDPLSMLLISTYQMVKYFCETIVIFWIMLHKIIPRIWVEEEIDHQVGDPDQICLNTMMISFDNSL